MIELTRFSVTATSAADGRIYEGKTTVADLQRADHSAYLTLETSKGTLLTINTSQMEAIHLDASREDFDKATDEFQRHLAQKKAENEAWKQAQEQATALKAEAAAEEADDDQHQMALESDDEPVAGTA
jgi:hypothetical protein